MAIHCPIEVPAGDYCMYCNNVHEPLIIRIPPNYTKRDIMLPLLGVIAVVAIAVILWVAHTYVPSTGIMSNSSKWGDGWNLRDGAWYFENI
jgi:hypothetical protein